MLLLLLSTVAYAQMSDQQVIQFAQAEYKAGTSQAQIVTKLVQKGVTMDQIRRLRNQYDKQINQAGLTGKANAAVAEVGNRLRSNKTAANTQELNSAQVGSNGTVENDAVENVSKVERDVQASSEVNEGTGKKVFGRDIFNNRSLTFEPQMNIATPQNYVLGPGDEVVVDIYGASQNTLTNTISPDGTITISGYGPIQISGLSVAAAQKKLRNTLGSRYKSSSLKLTLGNTRSILVNVMGEVKTPGTYTLSAFATVFHALYMAGGTNDLGTLRNIKVYRNGRLVTVVDVYQYILNGRLAGNIRLQDNDVIQVEPYESLVGITGNVKRPMFYEMRKNESVATLLKYAGGFTGDAHKKSVRLVRQTGERYQVYNVNEFDMATFKLADGDAITVDGILNRFENMVEIKGAVFRPGQFHLGEGVTSVRSLVQAAEGLTEDAYTGRAVLHRLKADRTLETQSLDLAGIMAGTAPDVPLRNEDVLFIMTQEDLRQERTFTISGQVMSPGDYEYAANTTIEDLIVMAGGLKDQASLMRVEVSRVLHDPYATQKTDQFGKKYHFDLKNGLAVGAAQSFLLEPYDHVTIYSSPVFNQARLITVNGEVNWEGTVAMENKSTHLSDVIGMAGGITPHAYMKGATLLRKMNDEERRRMSATMKAVRDILQERGDSVSYDKLDLDNNYPVYIDLERAMKNPGCEADILMREGDQVFVPEYNPIVRVSGDVMFPNTLFFESGKNYKYYVNEAGGFGYRAKKSKTFIVYQNGKAALCKKGAQPEPGCEIVVPSKKRKNPINLASLISVGTNLTALAAMVVALTRK